MLESTRSDGYPSIGQVVAGRYRLDAELGARDVGPLFRAYQHSEARAVSLQLVTIPELAGEDALLRLSETARRAMALAGPSVARVLDFGRTEQGIPFLVHEWFEGPTLAELLTQKGALAADRSARIADGMLAALAEAHTAGLVHGHLEAADLIIVGEDAVKLGGFGLPAWPRAPVSGYTPPEGATVPAGDVYAAGFILAEMVVGHPIAGRAEYGAGALPPVVLGSLLGAVAHRAVEPLAERRYRSAVEMRAHLAAVARNLGGRASPHLSGAHAPTQALPMGPSSIPPAIASHPPRPAAEASGGFRTDPSVAGGTRPSRSSIVGRRATKAPSAVGIVLLFGLLGLCALSGVGVVVMVVVSQLRGGTFTGTGTGTGEPVIAAPAPGPGSFGSIRRDQLDARILAAGWTLGNVTSQEHESFSLVVRQIARPDGGGAVQIYNYADPKLAVQVEGQLVGTPGAAVQRSGGAVIVVVAAIAGQDPGTTARALLSTLVLPNEL